LNFLYVGSFTGGREYWDEILDLAVSYQLYQLQEIVKLKMANEPPPSNISTLESELSNYVASEKYSDVKFSVEGKLIPAHKFVLVAQSDHFRNMFSGSFKETQDGIIKIYDCTEEVFLEVLRYLYTGQCNITESNCFGILEQANFFQLNRLTAKSEYFWYERLNIENAANVLDFANHFNASQLKQFAVEFIFTHVHEVAKSDAWKELDIDLISSVLIASVERGK